MGIFPEKMIDEVLRRLDAEAVLRRIDYRPEMIQETTGQGLKGFCPIHRETIFRTLLVDRQSKKYRCSNYNCPGNSGGDLIDLYARSRGIGYEQALMDLAGAFQIPVDLTIGEQYLKDTLEVAQNYLAMGVLVEAAEHFERILNFRENCLPALEGLMRTHEADGQHEAFRETRLRFAKALAANGQYDQAAELFRLHLQEDPEDADSQLSYIDCLRQAGQTGVAAREYVAFADRLAECGELERALEIYRTAESLNAEDLDVSSHVVQLLVSAGRREEAIAEWLKEMERRLELGNTLGAVKAVESALDLDSTREELCVRLAELIAEYQLGGEPLTRFAERVRRMLASRSHGPAALALDALERAFPHRPLVLILRADLEDARGNQTAALDIRLRCVDHFQQRHEFEAALNVLEQTMIEHPENVPLLSRKANLMREMGRSDEAVPVYLEIIDLFRHADEFEHAAAVYQTVIDLQPDNLEHCERQFDLYQLLGTEPIIVQKALSLSDLYRSRRELGAAANLLGRALRNAPNSPELLLRHGEILEESGRRAEAAEQFLAVAKLFLDQQDLDRARQVLEQALKDVPEHLEARETLGDVLSAQQMALQATSIYTDLAEFYLREKEIEAVIRIARKMLALQPEHLPTLQMLVKAYGRSGQTEEQLATQMRLVRLHIDGQSFTRATDVCEEILSLHEDYAPAIERMVFIAQIMKQDGEAEKYLWRLSQLHARGGHREQEQAVLEQILNINPLHVGANFRHLELLMLWGTPSALGAAIALCAERFEQAGKIDDAMRILEDLRQTNCPKAEVFAGLARIYRAKGDLEGLSLALRTQAELLGKLLRDDEALAAWDELYEQQPDDMTILRTRIEIMLRNGMNEEATREYRRLAEALIERRRYEEAELALIEVLNLNPDEAGARDELISIFIKTRDFTRAAEQIEDAAGAMLEEGRYGDAITIFERIFEFDTARDDIHRKLIAICQRMGDTAGMRERYEKLLDCLEGKDASLEFEQVAQEAIELHPDHWTLRLRLASFYAYHSRQREAEGVLLTLAVRQIEANQIAEAEATLDKILELNPDSVPARAHRAELLARKGKTEEALSAFMSLTGSLAAATMLSDMPGDPALAFRSGNYQGIMLLKEYTFDTFVVGARNNFAYASAMAVGRAPAKNYNPLFLYSDVGLGKTHLCHAIAHYIVDRHPQLKILYTTTEEFVGELIDAIQNNSITAFRNRHKLTDVLIIDDVQFLSGKERAQEEFFHVFNAIYQAGKQVVLTSDRPPKDIVHLEKRLKSRFGAGIIVDIQSPDLETRIAILRYELAARGREGIFSDEVLTYLAEQIETNVRDLKGALNQLLARQDFTGGVVDLDMTRQLLNQHLMTA